MSYAVGTVAAQRSTSMLGLRWSIEQPQHQPAHTRRRLSDDPTHLQNCSRSVSRPWSEYMIQTMSVSCYRTDSTVPRFVFALRASSRSVFQTSAQQKRSPAQKCCNTHLQRQKHTVRINVCFCVEGKALYSSRCITLHSLLTYARGRENYVYSCGASVSLTGVRRYHRGLLGRQASKQARRGKVEAKKNRGRRALCSSRT